MSGPYRGGRKPIPIPNDLAELIANGLTAGEVAQQHGVSIRTAHKWLRKSGIEMTPGPKPLPIPDGLADLIANGLSRADVAQQYGVSIITAHKWLQKSGVKMKLGPKPGHIGQRRCDHSAIRADRAAGMTLRAIADKHGITNPRVHQIVTNSSAKPAPKPPQSRSVPPQPERRLRGRELDTAIVAEWNKAKLTMREIGALYGVTRNSVARCLFNARARGEYVLAIDPATYAKRQSAGYSSARRDGLVEHAARMRAAKAAKRAAAQSPAGIDSVSSAVLTPAAWPAWNGEFVTIEDLMTVAKL